MFWKKKIPKNISPKEETPKTLRERIAAEEAGWQKLIKRRHQIKEGHFIPDPAAAP